MAADGTKTMKAKLDVDPKKEMKKPAIELVDSMVKTKKLFAKNITYEEKIDLNPKKWDEKKLSKAMAVLVRAELQLLAQRVGDIAKKNGKSKSMGDEIKMIGEIDKVYKKAISDIESKCSDALEELASGKGEAKAGIAMGKKAMAKVGTLDAKGVIKDPCDMAIKFLKDITTAQAGNNEDKAKDIMKKSLKDVEAAEKSLASSGKDAQNIAKFLLSTGKKMKGSELGQVVAFGEKVMAKNVQSALTELDEAMDKLESTLSDLADSLKKEDLAADSTRKYLNIFTSLQSKQKVADDAVKEMKGLEAEFKKVEKDLK